MKRVILGLAVLALLYGGVRPAKADLVGLTVDTKFYDPNLSSLYEDFGSKVVNPTAVFTLYIGETATITGTQIIYTSPTSSGTYATEPFNGYVFDFLNSGNQITNVVVDPSSTLLGFDPTTRLTLTSDGAGGQLVGLDLGQGLNYSAGATVVLDINPSSVPEPSILTLFGIGAACSLGYVWRRRQSA